MGINQTVTTYLKKKSERGSNDHHDGLLHMWPIVPVPEAPAQQDAVMSNTWEREESW